MPFQVPSPNARKHARIEIIPLIDIIFFLLATFVMVSLSMIQNKGISVNLPIAASGTPQDRKEITSISITAAGEVFFNKQLIDLGDLESALKQLKATQAEPRVFINGDAKAEYGLAVQVLDKVRLMGISKVAIETRPQSGGGSATGPAPAAPAPGTPAPAGTPAPTGTLPPPAAGAAAPAGTPAPVLPVTPTAPPAISPAAAVPPATPSAPATPPAGGLTPPAR